MPRPAVSFDRTSAGMGIRSQGYSMAVKDGVVIELNVEPSDEYAVSSAEAVVARR